MTKDYETLLNESTGNASMEKSYELPDGTNVSVGKEMFKSTELLFDPSLADIQLDGIHLHSYSSIMKCNKNIQEDLFLNVVLAGGSTMFKDMETRIQNDLKKLLADNNQPDYKVNMIHSVERDVAAWVGGSILAGQSTFQSWISKDKYEEEGPGVIHYKGM